MPLQKTTPEQIIRDSIQVFRAKGYYRTKMSDLAKATGLTKGAFYHHFSNKEEVMRKALQTTANYFEYKVFSIAYEEGLSGKEKLEKMMEKSFKAFVSGEGGCFFANTILETAHVEETFLSEISRFFNSWEKAFTLIFAEKYKGKALAEVAQERIADIEGSIVLMQLHRDPNYLKQAMLRTLNRL